MEIPQTDDRSQFHRGAASRPDSEPNEAAVDDDGASVEESKGDDLTALLQKQLEQANDQWWD